MKRIIFLFILVLGIAMMSGCTSSEKSGSTINVENKITIFKSPNCGCCVSYASELEKEGFQVETINIQDMSSMKEKYHIPRNMESCHTAIIGDYFIEGHVPIEAVKKLLEEKPQIDGIALPRMPAGSPGMPGVKKDPFKIYALSNGEPSEFMVI